MDTTRTGVGGGGRERREQLEALQVELREARAALALAKGEPEPAAVAALTEAVARAEARRAEVEAAHQALVHEAEHLERDAKWLQKEIDEERVLRRGSKLRDEYVEWADSSMPVRGGRNQPPTSAAASLGVVLVFGLMFAVLLLGGRC